MSHDNLCILFLKAPLPGHVKTRLQPQLTPQQSAALYTAMVEDQLKALADGGFDTVLFIAQDRHRELISNWLGPSRPMVAQQGADLGARMFHAFEWAHHRGYHRMVLIGSDTPGIDRPLMEEAFEALTTHDVVLGPSNDGGYYLIGIRQAHEPLFQNIRWSTSTVLNDTHALAKSHGLSTNLLASRIDIDTFADVKQLWQESKNGEVNIGPKTTHCLQSLLG